MSKESEAKRVKAYRDRDRKKYNSRQRELYQLNRKHKLDLIRLRKLQNKPAKVLDFSPRPYCKLFIKHCEGCRATFTTSQSRAKACKPSHTLKSKVARKHRKYKKPISRFYRKELDLIYQNRPEGMEVDHIIPINGDNVSGLHVPWNLQYLTPEANNKKSNKI